MLVYDPRQQTGYVTLASEPRQGERWSDFMEQLPDAQLERFLRRAKPVDKIRVQREGREGEVWSLKQKKLELRAVFLYENEPVGPDSSAPIRRSGHEIAAYKLDRMMDLGLVPVTVERELDGRQGSLQMWMQQAIDASQIETYGAQHLLEGLEAEIMQARVFNALIGGVERADFGKMLLPRERRIMLADSTKAFPLSVDVDELLPEDCFVSPDLELGMRSLDAASLQESTGAYLSTAQIEALLERRDAILAACGFGHEMSLEHH